MGICCSCSARKPTTTRDERAVGHTSAGSDDFDNSWFSIGSTSITKWMSQTSSSFTAIWGNNIPESAQLSDMIGSGDGALANGQTTGNSSLTKFTMAQMRAATYNYRSDMMVGRGGFGKVYKGWLKERVPPMGIKKISVAIKKLSFDGTQGLKERKIHVLLNFAFAIYLAVMLLPFVFKDRHPKIIFA